MFHVLRALKCALTMKDVSIDNAIFKLHYRFTTILLLAFCGLVTCRQYFGKPIECSDLYPTGSQFLFEQHCWSHFTFMLPRSLSDQMSHHPGISNAGKDHEEVYYQYYQWICYALFVQSMLFYIPHYLWKNLEGGRMKAFIAGINSQVGDKESRGEGLKRLSDQFFANRSQHTIYFFELLFCEVLNFVVVIAQIIAIAVFVGGKFSYYYRGYKIFGDANLAIGTDPLAIAFPREIECMFVKLSPAGDVQKRVISCVLHHNADNEKMYFFLWVWFFILVPLTALAILHRFLSNVVPILRVPLLRLRAGIVPPHAIERFARMASVGDWFFIRMLSKNVDPLVFKEFMVSVARQFEGDMLHGEYELSSVQMTPAVVPSSGPYHDDNVAL